MSKSDAISVRPEVGALGGDSTFLEQVRNLSVCFSSECFSSEEGEETPSWESQIDKELLPVESNIFSVLQAIGLGVDEEFSVRFSSCVDEEIVVGFDDEVVTLVDQLTGYTKQQLEFFSIVGMPGLGKSTLVRKVYNHPLVVYHFHIHAWICISQVYQKRDLLIGVLRCVIDLTDEFYEMSEDKLAEVLYKRLKGKRYLVVLDDMWNRGAWDDLKRSFPDDSVGSKIILTSRFTDLNLNLNLQTNTPNVLHLRFLTDDESWILLRKKVFHQGICPLVLEIIGKEIARKCEGLPLAIVVISGLLKSTSATVHYWRNVAASVRSCITKDRNQYMDTLALSYNQLPHHLRPLFLCLGVFPEDYEIPVSKLIWLWIAEGYIEQVGRESLEVTARDYLLDLLKRSLVVIAKTGSDGGIKSCRIHDLLRDLCLTKAEEEKYSPRIYRFGQVYPFATSFFSSSASIPSTNGQQQPSLYDAPSRPPPQPVQPMPSYPSEISMAFQKEGLRPWQTFKLLRVLDLESIFALLFPWEAVELIQLRYLAILAKDGSPPASVSNLLNLQTLIISSKRNITVPKSMWKLLNLRHLHIRTGENFVEDNSCSEEVLTGDGSPLSLDNLQTLSQIYPSPYCKDILASAPNLRKLGFCGPLISNLGNLAFPNLGFSDRLEKLKLLNTNPFSEATKSCNPFMFPDKLKNIALSNTALDWKEMWTLAMLPNLEVLKLKIHAFTGRQWETSAAGFQRLKFLKCEDLDIVKWKASSEHFPSLRRLSVNRCSNLLAIPSDLGNISTLELIEVSWCSDSAAESAIKIHTEQENLGNHCLKVLTTFTQ